MFSLLLTGCDDDGFSISASSSYNNQEETIEQNQNENNSTGGVHGGNNGSSSDEKTEEDTSAVEDITPGKPEEQPQPIDLGNQIISFELNFIEIGDDYYAVVSYYEDPFAEKYNFAYYTIDNKQLEGSSTALKETINEKETYKIFLGSKESKTYTIQFYDKDGKQYGKADLLVNIPVEHHSFFNNIVNIIEIKVVSIGVSIVNQFNKIKAFFKKIFSGNGLTI